MNPAFHESEPRDQTLIARYRHIVETASEGIWIIDAESKTTFVNRQMADMLGYTTEEMQGQSLFAFMDEEGRAIAEVNVERRRQGIKEQHDFKFRRKDGTDCWDRARLQQPAHRHRSSFTHHKELMMIFRRSELPKLEGIVQTDYPVKTTPAHDLGHFHYNITTKAIQFPPHKHDDFEEKWFILSGRATVYQNGVPHEVGPGDLIIHEIGMMHSMQTDEDVHWLCIGIHD